MNFINRRSVDSMITKWFAGECDYYKRALENPRPDNLNVFGWPQNLLVPKGNSQGFPCQLFAMVTPNQVNWGLIDKRKNEIENLSEQFFQSSCFSDDSKPLGYPFDRPSEDTLNMLSLLCADYRNMMVVDTKITFLNETTI